MVRAIYENGHLRLLDPVELSEGEQVQPTIQHRSETSPIGNERVNAARDDSAHTLSPDEEEIDTEALQRELDATLQGLPPTSAYIIQERHEGP